MIETPPIFEIEDFTEVIAKALFQDRERRSVQVNFVNTTVRQDRSTSAHAVASYGRVSPHPILQAGTFTLCPIKGPLRDEPDRAHFSDKPVFRPLDLTRFVRADTWTILQSANWPRDRSDQRRCDDEVIDVVIGNSKAPLCKHPPQLWSLRKSQSVSAWG